MSGLKQQIEKEFDKEIAKWTDRELYGVVSSLEKLKGLLADYMCIPKKELEEMIKNRPNVPSELDIVTGKACYDYAEEWFEKLDKVLEESK